MSYFLINEDGTARWLTEDAAPVDPRLSNNDVDDNDYEQVYVDARESASPGSDYVNVECGIFRNSSLNTCRKSCYTESGAELSGEYTSFYVALTSNEKKLVAEYDIVANRYCDDRKYRNQYLTNRLQCAYENVLSKDFNNNNNDTVIGYISVLIGQISQELSKTHLYCVLYSEEITDALMRFDIFLKMLEESNISDEVQIYAKGRYYQCVGDIMSARFAAQNYNQNNRWSLIMYATCAYSVALIYLQDLTIDRPLIDAHIKVLLCEIKLCRDYAFSYHNIIDDVTTLLIDKKLGMEMAMELFAKLETEKDEGLVSESFLVTNSEDVYDIESLDDCFDFDKDFVVYAEEVFKLHDVHDLLDHLLFIVGYSKACNYEFVPKFFPLLKSGPVSPSEISIVEAFLTIVSMSIEFCQVPCNRFGYDYFYRIRMKLPQMTQHSTSEVDKNHAAIMPVARHERPGSVKNLIWRALLEIGQNPLKIKPSKFFTSEQMLTEMIKKIKAEVNVTEPIHNGYIVSERFHLMLNWYHDNENLDKESRKLLNAHLTYLRRNVSFKPSRSAIQNASKTGETLTQKYPNLHLEWLFYPVSIHCSCIHLPNVHELIDYINTLAYEKGSVKYLELTAKLSPAFQAKIAEREIKANEVPGKPFSRTFLAESKAIEEECNALKHKLGYSIPKHLSWDRIRRVAQSSGQKLGHTKYQVAYKALSTKMRELTLMYRAETAQSMKPRDLLVVSNNLQHQVELQKTCALFCKTLENHAKWLSEKIRSIRRREEENRIRTHLLSHALGFPYNEPFDVVKFSQSSFGTDIEAIFKMLNDVCQIQTNGYVVPPEDVLQSTFQYVANLREAQLIERELKNLSLGDKQRVSTTLDYINGEINEECLAMSNVIIDTVFGPTVKSDSNVVQTYSSDAVTSTLTTAENKDNRSVTASPISLPFIAVPPPVVSTSKPEVLPKPEEKESELPATTAQNDSFKKAFQQWRRIYDDTPEHIVAEVLTPALTKSSLANYKPVIHTGVRPEIDPLAELEHNADSTPKKDFYLNEDNDHGANDYDESYAEDVYDTEDAEDYDYPSEDV